MPELPPASWHRDPYGLHQWRYWDGARWTNHVWPPTAPAPRAAASLPPPRAARESSPAQPSREERLSRVSTPTLAGWYPDPETGGTVYWDGSRWTDHTRPRRRLFAARSRDRTMIPIIMLGAGSYGYICIIAAYEGDFSRGWFAVGVATPVAALLYSVYLFRGRGPTTQQVRTHLRAQTRDTRPNRGLVWLDWALNALTTDGRAHSAYERGDAEYEVKLRIDDGSQLRRVQEIEAQGWRQVREVRHRQEKQTNVTAHSDGTHTVIRSSTQHATYYFVRDDD